MVFSTSSKPIMGQSTHLSTAAGFLPSPICFGIKWYKMGINEDSWVNGSQFAPCMVYLHDWDSLKVFLLLAIPMFRVHGEDYWHWDPRVWIPMVGSWGLNERNEWDNCHVKKKPPVNWPATRFVPLFPPACAIHMLPDSMFLSTSMSTMGTLGQMRATGSKVI